MRKSTREEFIKKADLIHSNEYNYDKFIYVNAHVKGIIICSKHGEFSQTPNTHLCGKGCLLCGILKNSVKRTKSINQFIQEANLIHNYEYNYDKFIYKNDSTKGIIICKIHREFLQTPSHHLRGVGCPACSFFEKTKPLNIFIEESNKIHQHRYDYSKFIYINNYTKGIIICEKHGDFLQDPSHHLMGRSCPRCLCNNSALEILWLDFLNIPVLWRGLSININNKMIKPDAIDKENKIIYEFYGDYWHGNPKIFKPEDVCKNGKTFKELYDKTIQRENFLLCLGYQVISIWESDFKEIFKKGKKNA